MTSFILQIGKQQSLPSLQISTKGGGHPTLGRHLNANKSHTLTLSLRKDHLANPSIDLLNKPFEVESLKPLTFTRSYDLS